MKEPVDKNLVKRFLHNTCTADEIERVKAFLLEPGSDELLHEIMKEESAGSWNNEGKDDLVSNLKVTNWNKQVRQRILAYDQTSKTILPFHKTRFLRYAAIWATILLTIGGGYSLYRSRKQKTPAAIAMMESVTTAGRLIKLKLSDSTIVYLNASSRINYPDAFPDGIREVYLSGEAFFDVAPDKTRPFLIHTDEMKVQVLGTSLNVRSYKDDKDASVTVSTGKVGVIPVNKKMNEVYLLPGDQMAVNRQSGEVSRKTVDPKDILAWQRGIFIFNYETLENITSRLEHWYGVSFKIKDHALLQQRYKLKEKNTDLNTVMSSLSHADKGFHYTIKNKEVVIW